MSGPERHAPEARRLAELIVGDLGVNLQPGQIVGITASPGQEQIWRALAEAAYRRGARFVDLWSYDLHVTHARLLHAPLGSLAYRPPWWGQRQRAIAAAGGAEIRLSGPVAPGLLDDVSLERIGIDMLPRTPEALELINAGAWNWIAAPGPSPGWAALLYPQLSAEAALDRLWRELAVVMRLDAEDPVAAWRQRFRTLLGTAAQLNALALDAVHFLGPGTDLVIGLLPGSRWRAAEDRRADGLVFSGNLPTEEVYTAPDPLRVHGHVSATRPLVLGGGVVRDLAVRFEHGRVVTIEASTGAELVRNMIAADAGAGRLGEVALVDGAGRVGSLGTVFYDTLLDENAASHIALGSAYPDTVADRQSRARINPSSVHVDFMIGSDDVSVTGVRAGGERVQLLARGEWRVAELG